MEQTKRFSYNPKRNSAVEILLRCYSLHQTMYRPAKEVDWCQCCQRGVSLYRCCRHSRPPCLKGAVTEGDWGIYPSTAYAVPLPLGEGGFLLSCVIPPLMNTKNRFLYCNRQITMVNYSCDTISLLQHYCISVRFFLFGKNACSFSHTCVRCEEIVSQQSERCIFLCAASAAHFFIWRKKI